MSDLRPISAILQSGPARPTGLAGSPLPLAKTPGDAGGFRAMLRGVLGGRGKDGGVREAAEQLVAITFVQPLLREARESSNAAGPFAPGAVEKQFGPLLDAQLSDRIVRASRWPLVDRVARDMQGYEDPNGQGISGRTEGAGHVGSD